MIREGRIYGLVAEFDGPEALVAAAARVREAGYVRTDAYSPFPVHGLSEALGMQRSRVAMIVLVGGITGAIGGYFMQWYANVVAYPLNVGGRPFNSWPAFVPI